MPVLFSERSLSEATLGFDSDQWLVQFKDYSRECIFNVYNVQNLIRGRGPNGNLSTSLPGDLFSLFDIQIRTLDKYLEENGFVGSRKGVNMLVDGLCGVLGATKEAQAQTKSLLLVSVEDCCAASNDMTRCADKMEELAEATTEQFHCLRDADEGSDAGAVRALFTELVETFSRDSVQFAEHTQVFLIRAIKASSLASDLFSTRWADDYTQNEVMAEILRIAGRSEVLVTELIANEYHLHKAITAAVKAIVCYYIRSLILVAESIERSPRQKLGFASTKRALLRMRDDISLFDTYVREISGDNAALSKALKAEVQYLELIHECLSSSDDLDSLESFIVVIHKRTGTDSLITRHFVGDLWMLVVHDKPSPEVDQTMASLDADLQMVTSSMKERRVSSEDQDLVFANLAFMLKSMYEDRIAQGALPVCWTCVPKRGHGGEKFVGKIKDFTKRIGEKKWHKLSR